MLVLSIEKKRELRVYLRILANTIGAVGLVAVLASCGTSPGYSYTIGGTVSGMVGSGMVLQNNGGDDLNISANGSFSFATALTDETVYAITVKTQPTKPSQTCSVSNGSGTVSGSLVGNVVVSCVAGPTSVTVDPSGKYAYSANMNNTIAAYTIQSDGTLSVGTPIPAGTYPTSITVDPLKRGFVYAANTVSGNISAYIIQGDGTLIDNPNGSLFPAGNYPTSVTIDPSGKFVYVANMGDDNIWAYTIQSDGTLANNITGSPFQAGLSPSSIITVKLSVGEFAYVANTSDGTISAYKIDYLNSGALNPICGGSTGNLCPSAGTYPSSVTVDPSCKFAYAINEGSNNISAYTIDQATGALVNNITGSPFSAGNHPSSVITVLVGSSEFAYVVNTSDNTISAYTIQATGALENNITGSPFSAGVYPSSVTVNNPLDGKFAYVANMGNNTISVFKINSNGTLTSP